MSLPARSSRLRMVVAYDGRPFQGWQSQAHRDTVQDRLESAFAKLCNGVRIPVHGSGRTDAGVHARGQVAHADVPGSWRHDAGQSRAALNANLPPEIRIQQARFVPESFHARFSAQGKVYRYRIWNGAVLDPFEFGRAWHFPGPLDADILQQAATRIVGRHDFAAFSANRGKAPTSTIRTIRHLIVKKRGPLFTLDIEGNGFLYKMVRLLTGSLLRCAQGRAPFEWIDELLAGRSKTSFAAPAGGLYLMRVLYGRAQPSSPATASARERRRGTTRRTETEPPE